ncbi:MAG: HINT domain-containing protein [Zoogloeaceae bacterium]|jgi:intein/homing endonuclease|nr:HINT domain-containing protein [Zoogloeaceae bacterium]
MLLTDGAGFIEGTLVHAREGLKPVEEIRVGDYVLSKPEDGKGEQAYKRVVRTMQFEDKEVWCVDIIPKSEIEQAEREGRHINDNAGFYFVVTPNHPFWVKGLGWTRADELYHRYREDDPGYYPVEVEFEIGEIGLVTRTAALYRTEDQDIAWLQGISSDVGGYRINLGENRDLRTNSDFILLENSGALDETFRCTVYNLEVEDFHTYYVGTNGVWVHNTNYARSSRGEFSTNSARAIPSLILLRKEKKCC